MIHIIKCSSAFKVNGASYSLVKHGFMVKKRNMAGRTVKITAEFWIETARRALIEEGIAGVKVDRLASRLGVTRGGFFHNFRDREALLDRLLAHWEESCRFMPPDPLGATPASAIDWLDGMLQRLIDEDGYDHRFDMAVREWARSDQRTAWAVERSDRQRLAILVKFFEALGYDQDEAQIRARVFYYHQIGYYCIDVRETAAERRRVVGTYLDILCGFDRLAAGRAALRHERLRKSA